MDSSLIEKVPHLTVDVNQVHQLFRLKAIPAHFALLFSEAQLKNTQGKETEM